MGILLCGVMQHPYPYNEKHKSAKPLAVWYHACGLGYVYALITIAESSNIICHIAIFNFVTIRVCDSRPMNMFILAL